CVDDAVVERLKNFEEFCLVDQLAAWVHVAGEVEAFGPARRDRGCDSFEISDRPGGLVVRVAADRTEDGDLLEVVGRRREEEHLLLARTSEGERIEHNCAHRGGVLRVDYERAVVDWPELL